MNFETTPIEPPELLYEEDDIDFTYDELGCDGSSCHYFAELEYDDDDAPF